MKAHILILALLSPALLSAQLTLEKIDAKKRVKLPPGATVTIKRPTPSEAESCDCFHAYTGKLMEVQHDAAVLVLEEERRIYQNAAGVARRIHTEYGYLKEKPTTVVPLQEVLAVSRRLKGRKAMDNLGGTLMLLSAFHAVVTAPLLSDQDRRTSDRVVLGVFGAGFVMAILPNAKTYHLQQPKEGKKKALWRLNLN